MSQSNLFIPNISPVVRNINIEYSDNFQIILNGKTFELSSIEAEILSKKISRLRRRDGSIHFLKLVIDSTVIPGLRQVEDFNDFGSLAISAFSKMIECVKSIFRPNERSNDNINRNVNRNEQPKQNKYEVLVGKKLIEVLETECVKINPSCFETLTTENVVEVLNLFNTPASIDFAARNISSLRVEEMLTERLDTVLRSPELSVASEDSLLDLIERHITANSANNANFNNGNNRNNVIKDNGIQSLALLSHVRVEMLLRKGCQKFAKLLQSAVLNDGIESLLDFLTESLSESTISEGSVSERAACRVSVRSGIEGLVEIVKKCARFIECYGNSENVFSGSLNNYFKSEIQITASSQGNILKPPSVLLSEKGGCFYTDNKPNSYIEITLPQEAEITSYELTSDPSYNDSLRCWCVEIMDGSNFVEIDRQSEFDGFNKDEKVKKRFTVADPKAKTRVIRITQTGKTNNQRNYFQLHKIELYGNVSL